MEDFVLKSVALSVSGADIRYRVTEAHEDGTLTENEHHVRNTRLVHPDLSRLFDTFAGIVAVVIGLDICPGIADGNERMTLHSASFEGRGENAGIVLAGTLNTSFGAVSFKTPRLKYADGRISATLTMLAARLSREVRAYIDGKTAEMEVL